MMAFKTSLVEAFFSVCIVAVSSNSAYSQLTSSDLVAIQWFDQLSFSNLENTKCVRVATGNWSKSGNDQPQNSFIIAFLLSDHEDSLSVFTRDLFTRTYTKTRPDTPMHEVVAFEIRVLASEAIDQLSQFPSPESVKNAKNRFGDRSIPRTTLLTTFRNFCYRFPDSEHAQRAKDTVGTLEEMLEEERQRPNLKLKTEMTKQDRIAELIFELRDQNGQEWSQPGWCGIFADPRGDESPAAQLRRIGYDAIPQLIEAMKDNRFSRSVGYHRDFYFSHTVLRVGECAEAIIASIAQRRFRDRKNNNSEQDVRLWWDEFQKKGEKQVLIESVSRGDDNAPYQEQLLVEKYPEAAFEALRIGVTASQKDWIRSRLIELVGGLRDDSVVDFLHNEMKNASGVTTRVNAARGLLICNRTEPILAMSEEWKRTLLRGSTVNGGELVDFLAYCGSADAINALGFKLANRCIDLRLQVVQALGETGERTHHFPFASESLFAGPEKRQELVPEVEAAVEELLVTALGDTEARLGLRLFPNCRDRLEPEPEWNLRAWNLPKGPSSPPKSISRYPKSRRLVLRIVRLFPTHRKPPSLSLGCRICLRQIRQPSEVRGGSFW